MDVIKEFSELKTLLESKLTNFEKLLSQTVPKSTQLPISTQSSILSQTKKRKSDNDDDVDDNNEDEKHKCKKRSNKRSKVNIQLTKELLNLKEIETLKLYLVVGLKLISEHFSEYKIGFFIDRSCCFMRNTEIGKHKTTSYNFQIYVYDKSQQHNFKFQKIPHLENVTCRTVADFTESLFDRSSKKTFYIILGLTRIPDCDLELVPQESSFIFTTSICDKIKNHKSFFLDSGTDYNRIIRYVISFADKISFCTPEKLHDEMVNVFSSDCKKTDRENGMTAIYLSVLENIFPLINKVNHINNPEFSNHCEKIEKLFEKLQNEKSDRETIITNQKPWNQIWNSQKWSTHRSLFEYLLSIGKDFDFKFSKSRENDRFSSEFLDVFLNKTDSSEEAKLYQCKSFIYLSNKALIKFINDQTLTIDNLYQQCISDQNLLNDIKQKCLHCLSACDLGKFDSKSQSTFFNIKNLFYQPLQNYTHPPPPSCTGKTQRSKIQPVKTIVQQFSSSFKNSNKDF